MPRKRLVIAVLVLLVIVAGGYQLRTQLLTRGVNAALANAAVRIVRLEGLKLGWRGVTVDQMVVAVGDPGVRQSLQGVHLAYSLVGVQLQSVLIERAVLTLPDTTGTSVEGDGTLLFSELLGQMLPGPIERLAVEELEVTGLSSPALSQPIKLNATWRDKSILLELSDIDRTLTLELIQPGPSELLLGVDVFRGAEALIQFHGSLKKGQGRQLVTGSAQLDVAAVFAWLSPLINLPDMLVGASGELSFELSGAFDDKLDLLPRAHWQLQILPDTKLATEFAAQGLKGRLQISFPEALDISFQPVSAQGFVLMLDVEELNWELDEQSFPLAGKGKLTALHCSYQIELRCQSGLQLALSGAALTLAGEEVVVVTNPAITSVAQLALEGDSLTATLDAGEWLRAEAVMQGNLHLSGPALVTESAGTVEYQFSSGELQLRVGELRLLLPRLELPNMRLATVLELQNISLSLGKGGTVNAAFHLAADGLNLQGPDSWLPELALRSDVVLAGRELSLEGQLQGHGNLPLFELSAKYQLDTERGSAQLRTGTLEFDAENKRLSGYFGNWPYPWDVVDGSMALTVDMQWQPRPRGTEVFADIKYEMTGLAGLYEDIGFHGLSGDISAQFRSPHHLFSSHYATITLDLLDIGVPVEAIEAQFQFDSKTQELALEDVKARLFGGRVWLEDAVLRAEQAHNKVFVGVDGIQLDQLLKLAGYDAVQATGALSGLLPLDVNKAGATMERGMLAAKAPGGIFSYQAGVTTDINPALVPVLAALKDYHYSVFQLEADYRENGDLELAMIFRGSNPSVQQGRPIHLNLNVSDNIPTLLKSLQAGRKVADTVGKQLGGG